MQIEREFPITYKLLKSAKEFSKQIAILDLENQVSLSYKELFAIAISLASDLNFEQKAVLICSKPSWKLIVSILAVWISKNYFFILDLDYPKERIQNITEILNPKVTLCDKDCILDLELDNKIYIEKNFYFQNFKNLNKNYSLLDKAYVVFTSGSTGKPKGILVSHEGIYLVLEYQKNKFELTSNSKTLHYLKPSFDAFLSELGTTLLSGGCYVIHSESRKSISLLQNLIQQEKITHVFLPPAILGVLEPNEKLSSLKVIVTGGEPTPKNVVRKWLPHVKLLSAYGPTETTICSHLATCDLDWDNFLGELLPKRKEKLVYLERENSYELWLGGSGLALEYLQNPSETFSKFIWVDGERWYRTGDIVKPTPKGLKFLRRKDLQIKLHGNRLELEEVEKILQNFSEILFCRALYLNYEDKKIFALVYHAKQEISKKILIDYLKKHFPYYLLPNEIFYLKEPVLNPNGKWDLDKIIEIANQKLFISISQTFFDSISHLQEEIQLERLTKLTKQPLVTLGETINKLKQEVRLENPPKKFLTQRQKTISHAPYLLLGATGYLGRFFLEECLKRSIKIYLLIRNSYQKNQILYKLKQNGLYEKSKLLEFFIGDASQTQFGLNPKEWEKLFSVSKIFNLAGSTNFLLTRQELASKNLEILRNCIALAGIEDSKEIHHVSTLSIFLLNDLELFEISENSKILETTKIYGGYAQSKWQAEFLLQQSKVQHYIYRLGLLVGDSQNGIPNPKDSFTFFLKCAHLWKNLDLEENLALDFLPVDIAAREILEWSQKPNQPTFLHIFGDSFYFDELKEEINNFNMSFTPKKFELEYVQFLLELLKSSYHRIHPLGLFLKTNRKFLSQFYYPPRFDKQVVLRKIFQNL